MLAIEGIHYETGEFIKVVVKDDNIHSIHKLTGDCKNAKYIIAPGLVDIQINGFMGIDFNKDPLNREEWQKVIYHLSKIGVTTFYPTIITNSYKHLAYIFEENMKILANDFVDSNMIGGFHLEGPYISKEDGPRGAHDKEFVRAPNWNEFCELQEKAQGMIKIITLSPEWDGAIDFIKKATNSGIKVALGHTAAESKQIREAVKAGAILSTHLGNGAHSFLPRHPNYIWDQLAEEQLWTSVIADGLHLPENVLKVIEGLKNEKMVLISDSVALAGMESGDYTTSVGGEVTLTKDGRLLLKDNPRLLAGSVKSVFQGVQHLVSKNICGLAESIHKASIYPAKLMGLPQRKGINIGAKADFILFGMDTANWQIIETYKNGKLVYQKGSV
ncbi:amidohydrolase family protein [Bacillus sp. FJAT-50079]|uniref:N-acetylglucosamine-6-phosphate deacetylase n=1 Tax=Bacillus sp. FJAT-50079 TaxID=2833577 RepID=UPI001BCA3C37|nr:amidohydrolase family protein [Bacillus sp. FJAT-50079]MBS4208097.1 amidohydrolase family protein [Bacillus sp. FJAT-50079]